MYTIYSWSIAVGLVCCLCSNVERPGMLQQQGKVEAVRQAWATFQQSEKDGDDRDTLCRHLTNVSPQVVRKGLGEPAEVTIHPESETWEYSLKTGEHTSVCFFLTIEKQRVTQAQWLSVIHNVDIR